MRNPHLWSVAAAAFGLGGLTCAVLAIALQESLWLDELHTSWSISGDSRRIVAERAASGNQTPLYFWIVAALFKTLGQAPDWIVRLPSVVAWLATIGFVALLLARELSRAEFGRGQRAVGVRRKPPVAGPLFVLGVVAWIVLDRMQWFYATEARPYALVQLVTLAGWFCIAELQRYRASQFHELDSQTVSPSTRFWWLASCWALLAIVSVYLHLTAILPVGCQWLVGSALILRGREQAITPERTVASNFLVWMSAAIAVAVACLPMIRIASPVWQRRAQWASFASDVSLANGLAIFPVLAILVPILIAVVSDRCWRRCDRSVAVLADEMVVPAIEPGLRWLWWSALLGPWLLAWLITALEIAPMFHRRFVIASALPLVIVGGLELLRVRRAWLRGAALVAVAGAIVFSQGSVGIWRQGYLVGQLRGEDWRGAAEWLSDCIEPGERLLFSSGLIEATDVDLPLDSGLAEYLAFPLGGVYQVHDSAGKGVPVIPLVTDASLWAEQVVSSRAERTEQAAASEQCWLLYRGAKGRMLEKLELLTVDLQRLGGTLRLVETQGFGRLWVAELNLAW